MPFYYDQYGNQYGTADMPFDYNQPSEIPGFEGVPVGELASQANPSIVNANVMFPEAPVNWIALTGTGSTDLTIIPGDDVGAILSRVIDAAVNIWGSADLGGVRTSEGYMPSDPTSGVRFGSIIAPRVRMPYGSGR